MEARCTQATHRNPGLKNKKKQKRCKCELNTPDTVNKVICHQVGKANRDIILNTIGVPQEKDFSSFEYLGNMGTVSVPLTAALAHERGFLQKGDQVAFLGIGSGLNCMMLGFEW